MNFSLSPFTIFVPCLPPSYRKKLSIIKIFTSHMSLFNHSKTVRTIDVIDVICENDHHTLCAMGAVSHVRCHMSLVTYHVSHIFYKVVKLVCWGSVINKISLVKWLDFYLNPLIPNIYISWLVVVRLWSLQKKQIYDNLIFDTLEYAISAKNGQLSWSRKPPNEHIFENIDDGRDKKNSY